MNRRTFLNTAGKMISLPFFINGSPLSTFSRPLNFLAGRGKTDRILVLIQLNGGNDGLNTLIPVDQYSNLYRARPNIIIPMREIIPVTDTLGFHPAFSGLKRVYEEGRLGIVQNVGYPNQNRSHFRSMEIWSTASPAEESWTTGWLGRYLESQYPTFPDAYPNSQDPDPFAIAMGPSPAETCQGTVANFSLSLRDPFSLRPLTESEADGDYGPHYREELDFVRTTIMQANRYGTRITDAVDRGANMVEYPDTPLANDLKNIVRLISGGLQTQIYVVSLGGFDTHANQIAGDPLKGTHQELLQTLSDGLSAFLKDLAIQRLDERVLGMTFSEFGRQIRSNGSNGTDHGNAAPLFLFGACVHGQILGDNPQIQEEVPRQAGVPMQFDFRDVYGSVLMDWFQLSKEQVAGFIHQDFQHLPVITGCSATSTGDIQSGKGRFFNMPNPFRNWTDIVLSGVNEHVYLDVLDTSGRTVQVLVNRKLGSGEHRIRFDAGHLSAGPYFLRLISAGRQQTHRSIKVG